MNILAKFKQRDDYVNYTTAIYWLLVTDPDCTEILNAETGEILYSQEAKILVQIAQ